MFTFINILAVSLVFAHFRGLETCLTLNLNAKLNKNFEDKQLSDLILWTLFNVTRLDCCMNCYEDAYCVSFHISGTNGVCDGLRHRLGNDSTVDVAGYSLFDIDKAMVGTPCDNDVDCLTLKNSHCHLGACRCDIGHDTYQTRCRILTECTLFSNDVTYFTNSLISLNNFDMVPGTTFASCTQQCITSTLDVCKSADYDVITKQCFLQSCTWYDVIVSDRVVSTNFKFIQRKCQWN